MPRVDHETTRTMSRVLERLTRRMGERRRRRSRRRAATFHRVSSRIVAQRLESFWTMRPRPACAFPSRPMQQEHHASERSSNGLANHWPDRTNGTTFQEFTRWIIRATQEGNCSANWIGWLMCALTSVAAKMNNVGRNTLLEMEIFLARNTRKSTWKRYNVRGNALSNLLVSWKITKKLIKKKKEEKAAYFCEQLTTGITKYLYSAK